MNARTFLRHAYLATRWLALRPLALGRRRAVPTSCRRILVVRVDRIGDLVLSTPFLRNLREAFPEAEITLLGHAFARDLLAGGVLVDQILSLDDGMPPDLGRQDFDLALDLHCDYVLRPALLARRARAACTVGFDIAGRGVLFDIAVPISGGKHFIDEVLDLLRPLGHEPKPYAPEIHLAQAAEEAARRLLAEQGVRPPYAACHPGGYYPEQRWPAARFAAIGDAIRAIGLPPVLLGSSQDSGLLEQIVGKMSARPAVVCGTRLGVSAGVIGASALFVGNNSGPLHIACALHVPSVSTMGPTDPVRFRPVSDRARVVRARRVDQISVEEMVTAIKAAVSQPSGRLEPGSV